MNSSTQEHSADAHQVADVPRAAAPMVDVMIDIETLGTKPGAAILSIGAVMFGPAGLGATFYAPVLLTSCTDAGLSIDAATVAWWMRQSDEARAAAFPTDAAPIGDVLAAFWDWMLGQQATRPWSHGAGFDIPLLEAAFQACGLSAPWTFSKVRDTRTLYDLAGVKVDRSEGTHHNALDDAIAQAKTAALAMRILRARGDATTLTPALLEQICEAFRQEADADAEIQAGGPGRLLAFDYFKRGWLGNGAAVNVRLAAPASADNPSTQICPKLESPCGDDPWGWCQSCPKHCKADNPSTAGAAEPERLSTDESREYLVKFMEQHFTDKTYHRYIRGERGSVNLAGDFAWQMARALRMVLATPASQAQPSAAEVRDQALEEAARICESEDQKYEIGRYCAVAIRALKGQSALGEKGGEDANQA